MKSKEYRVNIRTIIKIIINIRECRRMFYKYDIEQLRDIYTRKRLEEENKKPYRTKTIKNYKTKVEDALIGILRTHNKTGEFPLYIREKEEEYILVEVRKEGLLIYTTLEGSVILVIRLRCEDELEALINNISEVYIMKIEDREYNEYNYLLNNPEDKSSFVLNSGDTLFGRMLDLIFYRSSSLEKCEIKNGDVVYKVYSYNNGEVYEDYIKSSLKIELELDDAGIRYKILKQESGVLVERDSVFNYDLDDVDY